MALTNPAVADVELIQALALHLCGSEQKQFTSEVLI
jgi:hypothetical protein